jgi:hypothetical protein
MSGNLLIPFARASVITKLHSRNHMAADFGVPVDVDVDDLVDELLQ